MERNEDKEAKKPPRRRNLLLGAACQTFILAKNAAAALLLARGTSFTTAAVADDVPPHTPAPCHMPPPNNMLIVTSLMMPDTAALKPRQHCVRRPTPATALTPRQYRWRCCPRRDGSVGHVALASSSSAARLGSEYVLYYFLLAFLRVFRVLFFYSEQGQIAWSYS
jgi:hypothetical protein